MGDEVITIDNSDEEEGESDNGNDEANESDCQDNNNTDNEAASDDNENGISDHNSNNDDNACCNNEDSDCSDDDKFEDAGLYPGLNYTDFNKDNSGQNNKFGKKYKKWDKNGKQINNNSNNNNNNKNSKKKWNNNNNNNSNNNNNNNNNRKEQQVFSIQNFNKNEAVRVLYDIFRNLAKKREFQPLNSWPLRLQYRFGSAFFFIVYIIVIYGWYSFNEIYCINSSYAPTNDGKKSPDEIVPNYIVNICLSYSYLENEKTKERNYILFYRWVPYAFLVMAMVYYLPRLVMKRFGCGQLRSLFVYLTNPPQSLGTGNQGEIVSKICGYFKSNLGSHKKIYGLFAFNHFLASFIVCASIYFFNFVLQGQFLFLSFYTLFYERDTKSFTDPLSIMFPPFVTCLIDQNTHMQNERKELFYCHFTLMEFYEKVFLFVWIYLTAVFVMLMLSCLLTVILPLPFISRYFLRTYSKKGGKAKLFLHDKLDFGDLFVLYLVKDHVSEALFIKVLESLVEVVLKMKDEKKETEVGFRDLLDKEMVPDIRELLCDDKNSELYRHFSQRPHDFEIVPKDSMKKDATRESEGWKDNHINYITPRPQATNAVPRQQGTNAATRRQNFRRPRGGRGRGNRSHYNRPPNQNYRHYESMDEYFECC